MNPFRQHLERALGLLPSMDKHQLSHFIKSISDEYFLLENIFESLPIGLIVLNKNSILQFINKNAERFIPIQIHSVKRKKVWDLIQDVHIANFIRETITNEERVRDREFSIMCSKGRRIISISIMPLVKKGHILGTIIHLEDVTEKREQEARLSRAERLASLTTLTASVAHEIKNPLAAISIHIQLIQKSILKNQCNTQFIEKHLEVINDEVDRLNNTIVDFLFAVRPMNVQLEKRKINNILSDLLELVEPELKEAGIQFQFDREENIPLLLIDEKYIKQAFLNIIKNAMSAMEETKEKRLTIRTHRKDHWVQIDFSDTGIGIPEDEMSKIFEPYYTTKEYGSGLGLTALYKVIHEHRGELQVDSGEGRGSTFTVNLPIEIEDKPLLPWNRKGEV